MPDTRERLEAILGERIAVLDGSWGVLIQSAVRGEEAYRGERFRDHPRDVAGDPDLLNLTRPEIVRASTTSTSRPARTSPRPTRSRRRDRPGRLRARGGRRRDEPRGRPARAARPPTSGRRGRRAAPLRRRLGRAAQRLALALAARRRPRVPRRDLRRGRRGVRRADARAPRGRRRPAPDRDRLRHAEREGGDRRRAGRRAGAAALALVHGRRPQRPQPLRPDRRGVLDLGRARAAARSSASTARSAPREMRPFVEDLAGLAPTWVACYPNAGPAERARRARRAAGGHEPLPRRVRARRARQHRRRLLRHDAGARPRRSPPRSRASRRAPCPTPRAGDALQRARAVRAASPDSELHDDRRADERHRLGALPAPGRGEATSRRRSRSRSSRCAAAPTSST